MKKLIFIGVVGLFVLGSCNSKNTGHEGHDHETVTHNHDEHEGHDHEVEGHDHEAEGADHSHEGECSGGHDHGKVATSEPAGEHSDEIILPKAKADAAGVKVNISYLPGGTQQERLDYLRKHRFDVWLGGTSEEYFMADEQHILQPYIAKDSYKVPAELRNRTGQWTSLYLSYIALLSNKNNLHAYGLYAPETWDELLAPQLKDELAVADFDLGGASYGMITSIWQMRGKEQAMAYAAKLNAQQPVYTKGFGEAVDLVYIGKKTVAVVPLDYALMMEARHRHLFATVVKDANRTMLTGAAMMRSAEHPDEARAFLDYLMSDAGVELLPANGYHYMWHVKKYPYNDGRRELIGNVRVPVDDLSWTSVYKSEIIRQWRGAL